MPEVDLAAKRYALAAFELAVQAGAIDAWRDAVERIAGFMARPDVKRMLDNTRAAQAEKQRLIEAALNDLPPQPLNLARLLVRKNRTALGTDIATEFGRLAEEHQGIARARATTAVPLSDTERNALSARLQEDTGNRIVLETAVDPAVLGGVVVQIGDRLIDASTRARLEALRQNLVGSLG